MDSHDQIQVALVMGGGALGLMIKLVLNIADLSKNIAVVVERVDSHEKRIGRLEIKEEN